MNEKVLVTGAAGFIGSHVTDELIRMGKSVLALDDLSGGFRENVHPDAEFIEGSVQDIALLEHLFSANKITHIYHLGAYAAEGLSHFIRNFNYRNNLLGSINLINLAVNHNVRCFVFTSSIAVYGKNQLPYTEETVPQPEDPYGIAKYAIELDLKSAHELFGLNYVIFRPHNVYGERQNIGDKYRNVIGIYMNNILKGYPLPVFGDGEQTRAFSYISDVAIPIARAGFDPATFNEVYNIGADKPYTINELIKVVSKEFNVNPQVNYLRARNEVQHAWSTHEKAERAFGNLVQHVGLAAGISRMAEWVRREGAKSTPKFEGIEIERNLPDSWR
jgi:UDP-glucose 4-epimerase